MKIIVEFYLYKVHIKFLIKIHTNLFTWYDIAVQTVP